MSDTSISSSVLRDPIVPITHPPCGVLIFTAHVPLKRASGENKVLKQFVKQNQYIKAYIGTRFSDQKKDIVMELFQEILANGHIEDYNPDQKELEQQNDLEIISDVGSMRYCNSCSRNRNGFIKFK